VVFFRDSEAFVAIYCLIKFLLRTVRWKNYRVPYALPVAAGGAYVLLLVAAGAGANTPPATVASPDKEGKGSEVVR